MFPRFFIERPVLANVLALVTLLLGGVALFTLPVSLYPPLTPPTIQVSANYPGADARTLMATVALPIEQQINGVEGMLYMQSTCTSDGRYTLTVTFDVGTDLDLAQVLVQNRISAALAQLPEPVQQQGVTTKKRSTAILQIITLTSSDDAYDALFLSNFATQRLHDRLARVDGVSDVNVFGIGEYSMRVWLNPDQMRQRSLMPSDVLNAIQQQNQEVAAGQLSMPPAPPGQEVQTTIDVASALATPEEFENIIVKFDSSNEGEITRLRDVGRVELGAKTYSQFFKLNGRVAGGIAIYQLPDANALSTANRVKATMADLARDFPPGLQYTIPFDTTTFIQASISEVYSTLFETGILVLFVIVVFLQSGRATLVPATTVPVTIIGAFAAMAALGFSVNLLTLFAIVLAIGVVVDDAIVVVEGTAQHLEQGQSPKDATISAMRELLGPILGITLVLMSVFVPPAFMPGITGQMYRQFALVIAATALISAVNAATLKPTQCALWLRPIDPNRRKNFFFRGFDAVFDKLEQIYLWIVQRLVRRSRLTVAVGLGLMILAMWGLVRVPTGFIPTEDQGYAMVSVQLPDGASLERTEAVMDRLTEICQEHPAVQRTIAIGGMSPLDNNASLASAGIIYLMFKDWKLRGPGEDLLSIYDYFTARLARFPDARTIMILPPPIPGLGLSGGFQMQVQLNDGSGDFERLQRVSDAITSAARANPVIRLALSPLRASVPQISVNINRTQTETLGVAIGDVQNTVQTYLGSSFVNYFTRFGRNYTIYAQADAPYRLDLNRLREYSARNQSGNMVPLGAVAEIEPQLGPSVITLYNLRPSASIFGSANAGYSSGQAMETLAEIAKAKLPPEMSYEWTAMSYQEELVGNSPFYIMGLALLLVYFVLSGQFESWVTPSAVILAVPLALVGTVSALLALGVANNIYVQIGLVLLIALSAKNAILIVEKARAELSSGRELSSAVLEGAKVRFRPILMTSLTFILGVLPLLLASGAGASARKSLGLAVLSGMITSTCFAVLLVPALFVILQRREKQNVERLPELS